MTARMQITTGAASFATGNMSEADMAFHQSRCKMYILALVHRRNSLAAESFLTEADTLRMYEALTCNPLTAQRIAQIAGVHLDLVNEWLGAQVRQGRVEYDATRQQYWLTEEQASALDRERGQGFLANVSLVRRRMGPCTR